MKKIDQNLNQNHQFEEGSNMVNVPISKHGLTQNQSDMPEIQNQNILLTEIADVESRIFWELENW